MWCWKSRLCFTHNQDQNQWRVSQNVRPQQDYLYKKPQEHFSFWHDKKPGVFPQTEAAQAARELLWPRHCATEWAGIKSPFCLQDKKEVYVLEAWVFGWAVTQARQQCCHQASEGNKNQANETEPGNVQAELGLNMAGCHIRLTHTFICCLQGKLKSHSSYHTSVVLHKTHQKVISLNKNILFKYAKATSIINLFISLWVLERVTVWGLLFLLLLFSAGGKWTYFLLSSPGPSTVPHQSDLPRGAGGRIPQCPPWEVSGWIGTPPSREPFADGGWLQAPDSFAGTSGGGWGGQWGRAVGNARQPGGRRVFGRTWRITGRSFSHYRFPLFDSLLCWQLFLVSGSSEQPVSGWISFGTDYIRVQWQCKASLSGVTAGWLHGSRPMFTSEQDSNSNAWWVFSSDGFCGCANRQHNWTDLTDSPQNTLFKHNPNSVTV